MATILVIDDNETIRIGIKQIVEKMGHLVLAAASGTEGIGLMKKREIDFLITDLKMEGMDGVQVLRSAAELDPDCPAMIITAFGSVETAVETMKLGAFDFIEKPFAPEVIRLKVERAIELRMARKARHRLESENEYLREQSEGQYSNLVGSSGCMNNIFKVIDKVAPTDSSVFISGESGTGKELVARAIHAKSNQRNGPFIKVNCGALIDTLLESELFGHEKGAFTGAIRRKLGRFELADGGTLFLDEIGDVSPSLQLKLLRVLQEQEFERVGGETTISVNVRVLSATNKNLQQEVREGRFREDLYYRLHIVPLLIPPLRDKREDIPLLVAHFIKKLAPKTNPKVSGIEDSALGRLMSHSWPGNVRELENVIEQSLVFSDGEKINISSLPEFLRGETHQEKLSLPTGDMSLPDVLEDLERQLILKAFHKAEGVKTETARLLGIKTSALYYKLEKYNIS